MRMSTLALSLALASGAVAFGRAEPTALADVELPRSVPGAKLTQQVGLTEIGVEYDCPAAAGRKIWGGVVPYDKLWLIGTNPAAKVKFSRDVTIGDRVVPAGTYWLLAIPGKATWTVVFNKSGDTVASAADYKPELDVARLKLSPKATARRERLIFSFSDISEERASLDLEWDGLRLPIPIQVNTSQQVLSSINSLDSTWRSFANAARYMLETKKDYDAGLKYIDEALALKEDWYAMWVKGALYAAKGDYAAASDWAERAYDLEQKVGNGGALEPDLTKAIADWSRKGHRLDKEARPATRIAEPTAPAPIKDAATPPVVKSPPQASLRSAETEPPKESPKDSTKESMKAQAPADDPPPALRRARLRRR
jgi:hypothetical protein